MPIGFASDVTQLQPGNITNWKVKRTTQGTYSLLPLADGAKFDVKSYQEPDSFGKDRPFGATVEPSARMLRTTLGIIEILPSLNDSYMTHGIYFGEAKTIKGAFGMKWKLVSDADMDRSRYVEISADMGIELDGSGYDLTDLFGAPAVDTAIDAGDTLYPLSDTYEIATYGAAQPPKPAGIKTFKVCAAAGTPEDVGIIRKGKFTAESVTQMDGQRRSIGTGLIKVSAEIELMQTKAEQAFLKSLVAPVDYQLTFQDALVFTIADSATGKGLGISWSLSPLGSVDDLTVIKLIGNGTLLTSDWAGAWA